MAFCRAFGVCGWLAAYQNLSGRSPINKSPHASLGSLPALKPPSAPPEFQNHTSIDQQAQILTPDVVIIATCCRAPSTASSNPSAIMGQVHVRNVVAFPPGDNSSDTLIEGIHWNLTTLEQWNYTYYSNGTLSNGSNSNCFVIFEPYTPYLLPNGTFLNSTSCYSPIGGLGTRSKVGLFFACFFAATVMFTFVNLRKHGRMFLPVEKRFRPIGRRWQWYWMLTVAALGMISAFTGIDVDRCYLPQLPIVLTNFAWFLMLPTTMGAVWEGVRHWGSWQERQMVDPNPFILKQDDWRSRVEFWLPLVFYFFAWLV